jgi:hypothetical protein
VSARIAPVDADALLCEGGTVGILPLKSLDERRKFPAIEQVGDLLVGGTDERIPNLVRAVNEERRALGMQPYPEPRGGMSNEAR